MTITFRGYYGDIHRTETSGTAAGMGGGNSGLQKQRCRQRGTTPTTYYRWERELLSIAGSTATLPETPTVAFAELPVPKQVSCNVAERSATLHLDNVSIDIYPQCGPEQLKALVEILRTC